MSHEVPRYVLQSQFFFAAQCFGSMQSLQRSELYTFPGTSSDQALHSRYYFVACQQFMHEENTVRHRRGI